MRLSKEQIREILIANSQGEAKSAIAQRLHVDVSTVRYHVEIFERTYGASANVYAIIRPIQKTCNHPSLKCLVCGMAHDNLHRRETETICRLSSELDRAKRLLSKNGITMETDTL